MCWSLRLRMLQRSGQNWIKKVSGQKYWESKLRRKVKKLKRQSGTGAVDESMAVVPTVKSFADSQGCKNLKDGSVLLVGDSMARGVGNHLRADNNIFDVRAFGGARVEDIEGKIDLIEDKQERHLIVMAGTNNLYNRDGSTEILLRKYYKELIEKLKAMIFRKDKHDWHFA